MTCLRSMFTSICRQFIACDAPFTLALPLLMAFTTSATSQVFPPYLNGPENPIAAGYSYLSYVLPGRGFNVLNYEVCNPNPSKKLAFAWLEPGFEMLPTAPLYPRLCAIYRRSASDYQTLLNSTLRLSGGEHPANTYVECDGSRDCKEIISAGSIQYASLFATMPNRQRPEELSPLAIAISSVLQDDGSTRTTIVWGAEQGGLIMAFPRAKSEKNQLPEDKTLIPLNRLVDSDSLLESRLIPKDTAVSAVFIADVADRQYGSKSIIIPPGGDFSRSGLLIMVAGISNKIQLVFKVPLPSDSAR